MRRRTGSCISWTLPCRSTRFGSLHAGSTRLCMASGRSRPTRHCIWGATSVWSRNSGSTCSRATSSSRRRIEWPIRSLPSRRCRRHDGAETWGCATLGSRRRGHGCEPAAGALDRRVRCGWRRLALTSSSLIIVLMTNLSRAVLMTSGAGTRASVWRRCLRGVQCGDVGNHTDLGRPALRRWHHAQHRESAPGRYWLHDAFVMYPSA